MLDSHKNKLYMRVNAFKEWAKSNYPTITEESDNGEWCFGYEFDEMVSEALCFVDKNPVEKADQQIIDNLLYVIARDNECSTVITELEKSTE